MKLRPELLLDPILPLDLHGLNPRTLIPSWWNKERKKVYEKYNYCCAACGKLCNQKGALHAHELYKYKNKVAKLKEVVALCKDCHNFLHTGRLNCLLHEGSITANEHKRILNHGFAILEKANLSEKFEDKFKLKDGNSDGWCMIIDGVKHKKTLH